jgi:ribosomal protein S18 acetylase RimI-like enzyme
MSVRKAEERDVAVIAQLVERSYERYVERIGRRPAPMDQDYAARVRAGGVFVWDEGGVTGVLVLVTASDHLLIENVAVDPRLQGQGIGRGLMDHAEYEAAALGLDEIRLYTNAAMSENLSLYPHLGYREEGRRTEDGFARVYFSKRLGPSARV